MTSPQEVGAEWSVDAVHDKKIDGRECRARLQGPSQRLADVRWVKTGRTKHGVTAQSAARECHEAGVRVTRSQSDRRWKAFQEHDGMTNAVRCGTQNTHGGKL